MICWAKSGVFLMSPLYKNEILTLGDLRLKTASAEIYYKNEQIKFTPKEYELIKFMLEDKNQVFTRTHLLDTIWGEDYYGNWI